MQINTSPPMHYTPMKYIISFTTSPARIHRCGEMLNSVLQQTRKADMVILNIPDVFERTGEKYNIPKDFPNQITINRCGRDWGPATKIVPTVQLLKERGFDPDTTRIIYLDDDHVYPLEMIERYEREGDVDWIWCGVGFHFVDLNIEKRWGRHGVDVTIAEAWCSVVAKLSVFKNDFIEYMDKYMDNPATRFSDDLVLSNYYHKVGVPIKELRHPQRLCRHMKGLKHNGGADALGKMNGGNQARYLKAIKMLDKQNERYFKLYSTDTIPRARQLIRQRASRANWEKLDAHAEIVLNVFRQPGAKSLIRNGDGEARVLETQHPLASGLAEAIRHADCIGLAGMQDSWKSKPLISSLRRYYKIEIDKHVLVSSYLFTYVPELIGKLAKGKRVLWITGDADRIVNNFADPEFRNFYGFHDIVSVDYLNAPGGYSGGAYPSHISPEQSLTDIQQQLAGAQDFDLAFVGVGVVGKLVCHHIKSVLGKSAVDVGVFMSFIKGSRERGQLVLANIESEDSLAYLVWDPGKMDNE